MQSVFRWQIDVALRFSHSNMPEVGSSLQPVFSKQSGIKNVRGTRKEIRLCEICFSIDWAISVIERCIVTFRVNTNRENICA